MREKILWFLLPITLNLACSGGLIVKRSKKSGSAEPSSDAQAGKDGPSGNSNGDNAGADASVFSERPAGLRALSRPQIAFGLQDMLGLANPPRLSSYNETTGKVPIYRQAMDIVPDGANLRALDREIATLLGGVDLAALSQKRNGCDAVRDQECRKKFVIQFASQAWRRPLAEEESRVLTAQCDGLNNFASLPPKTGFTLILRNILYDPRFLYLSEIGTQSTNETAPTLTLSPWESLSVVSYALTMAPPSLKVREQFTALGAQKESALAIANDMIHSPAFSRVMSDFLSQWIMVYGLETMVKPTVAEWSPQVAYSMLDEFDFFVRNVLDSGGGINELLLNSSAARPEDSAGEAHLGIHGTRAFLTSTSKTRQGSMIIRGVHLYRDSLCQNMPSPPPTLDVSPPKDLDPNDPSYEEKLALSHGSRNACKGCHSRIDPIGLSLHGFNGVGAPSGRQVDFPSLNLTPGVDVSLDSINERITTSDSAALAKSLQESTVYRRCFARHAVRYLIGRALNEGEIHFADSLSDQHLAKNAGGIQDFFSSVIAHPRFFERISNH